MDDQDKTLRDYKKCSLRLRKRGGGRYTVETFAGVVLKEFDRMIPARKWAESQCKQINPNFGRRPKAGKSSETP